ncbi:hypothetical protein BpHYR1_034573 [Brachionus plicatilis]|uniref:Uncharacterized protein n=1 Tax=Brachionus plicatilis TaxID=10195 RepID=A0A3M7R8P7_BRAPC|nr:hypothetical protein BpHYR1_034573 [Brachionus plicatilis]
MFSNGESMVISPATTNGCLVQIFATLEQRLQNVLLTMSDGNVQWSFKIIIYVIWISTVI